MAETRGKFDQDFRQGAVRLVRERVTNTPAAADPGSRYSWQPSGQLDGIARYQWFSAVAMILSALVWG